MTGRQQADGSDGQAQTETGVGGKEGRRDREIELRLSCLAAWKPCKQVAWEMEYKNTNSIQKDSPEYSAKKAKVRTI